MKHSPEELYKWWKQWDLDKPLIERDSLIEAMKRSGLYPDESILGVYPDTLDPRFADHLFEKKEFADLRSTLTEEDLCSQKGEFDTTAVQRFIARFMNPSTPYTSALLYHGVGVGKTCTAITVAEDFLDMLPDKKVIILAPPSIADNFNRTIFDVHKLVKLPKHDQEILGQRWDSPQCTGIRYLTMSDTLLEKDFAKITKEVKILIKKRYITMGYGEFANYVKNQILGPGRIPAHIVGEERIRLENEELYHAFSDHLMIIDEAHNLPDEHKKGVEEVDSKAATALIEGKKLRAVLDRILPIADGMRLLLMTATPMYNISTELIGLLNIMILNDTKEKTSLLKREDFFNKKDELLEGSEEKIIKIAKRYVSFMRGENPYSFPLRLFPSDILGKQVYTDYPAVSLSKKEKTIVMDNHLKHILETLPIVPTIYDPSTIAGKYLQASIEQYHKSALDFEESDKRDDKIFSNMILESNIVYSDKLAGIEAWKKFFVSEEFGEPKVLRYLWTPKDKTVDSIFEPSVLHIHAPKIAKIIKSVKTCKGIGFVYSRSITGGITPFAIALERAGWTRVLANGHAEPLLKDAPPLLYGRQCALCEHHEREHAGDHPFTPANYVLLAGDTRLTSNIDATVQYAMTFPKTNPSAIYGSNVKLILGSKVASEGLDFKCIREIHLLDPWWHLNRIEQIIGRGVRFCSHALLPMEKRTCTIYLHASMLPSAYETPDLYSYRLAAKKSIQIGILQRALKVGAFDCNIHHDVLFIGPGKTRTIIDGQGRKIENYSLADKQYSSFCDFMEPCAYDCTSSIEPSKIGFDISTYKVDDLMRYLETQFNKIKKYFQSARILYISLKEIKKLFFKDVPWELVSLGLRKKINNASYIIEQNDGTRGVLELQNGYLVYKPLLITDPEIPIALRHGYAYGRLADHMISPLLTSRIRSLPEAESSIAISIEEGALRRIQLWLEEIQLLAKRENAFNLERKIPEGMTDSLYRLIQWIPYRFRDFIHIEKILMQFYMDRVWTLEERQSVLAGITERKGADEITSFDTTLLSYLSNPEIFETEEGIQGFTTLTKAGKEIRYCKTGKENPLGECSTSEMSLVENVLQPPLNGIDGCAPLYGFHAFYKTKSIFKILNTLKLSTKNKVFTGSDCLNSSNLKPKIDDLLQLYGYQKDSPNSELLKPIILGIRETREEVEPYMFVDQLKADKLCMYTEMLLRAFQAVETRPVQWVLSLIDAYRAVETKVIKNKTVTKQIFINSFKF